MPFFSRTRQEALLSTSVMASTRQIDGRERQRSRTFASASEETSHFLVTRPSLKQHRCVSHRGRAKDQPCRFVGFVEHWCTKWSGTILRLAAIRVSIKHFPGRSATTDISFEDCSWRFNVHFRSSSSRVEPSEFESFSVGSLQFVRIAVEDNGRVFIRSD